MRGLSRKPSLRDRLVAELRPTPWSERTLVGKVRLVVGGAFALSAGAMAWAATTADSDWNITQETVAKQFG